MRKLFRQISLCSFILCLTVSGLFAQQTRGITPEDYYAFEFASDPNISPDGKLVAYVVTKVDRAQNRRNSAIWIVAADGNRAPWQFTTSPQNSNTPRWSPDGKWLAFLSSRPDAAPTPPAGTTPGTPATDLPRNQIYLLSMNGGEARRLTNLKNGVSTFRWSPDGTRMIAVSRLGPSDSRGDAKSDSKDRSDVRHYKNLSYKFNDTGWFDDRRTHLWVVDVASGSAKQVTEGHNWNDSDPQWSPDGKRIAFVSNRTGKEYNENRNTDVWVITAEGGEPTKISDHDEADNNPRWSPDGKQISFTGELHDRDHPKIFLAPATGGAPSVMVAKDLDLIPSGLEWAADGGSLYFETGVKGESQLFRVDLQKQTLEPVTSGPRAVHNVDFNWSARMIAYTANDFKHLDNVYVADVKGGNERQLTNLNEALWKQLQLADVERFTYKSADNWDVDGFIVKPIGWQEGKKYPLILSVHGGPAGQYGVDWYQEFQVYAAQGYAVLFTNPRGSTGYGQKFERGIAGEWGGKDYQDVMNGVDAALKKYPWIDAERMGVTGGSYGGYLTNWIVGHTDRFKAAVTLRSVVNFLSDEGTRDGAYGHSADFGGDLFERFDLFWDRSPLKYAKNVKTPTLILHSDNDFRVPLEQGEQWFRALKHFGVTTEIVMFPRENHNLTRSGEPKHLVESLNWQLYWFDRFINGNANSVPPDQK
ncbi:MAG: peptidase prolyl oligopeptidase active site domain protein [Acidobacteria bacterium]|nr:peptidase prolyl oligopeptidase active site domain protein [Acidobacteriota bacterium]